MNTDKDILRPLREELNHLLEKKFNHYLSVTIDYNFVSREAKTVFRNIEEEKTLFKLPENGLRDQLYKLNEVLPLDLERITIYDFRSIGQFEIKGSPSFPEMGISAYQIDTQLNELDFQSLVKLLESEEPSKVELGVAAIKENPALKQQIESRYLNLVIAANSNQKASLDDFPKLDLYNKSQSLISLSTLSPNQISFAKKGADASKMIVDILGAMVANHIDINEFLKSIARFNSIEEMENFLEVTKKVLFYGLNQEAQEFPEGWFSKIVARIMSMKISLINFDHTNFEIANKSLYLQEFWLLINLLGDDNLVYDIHQSTQPNLTPLFWITKSTPHINWSDVTPKIPSSVLQFLKFAFIKYGDEESWKQVSNFEKANDE